MEPMPQSVYNMLQDLTQSDSDEEEEKETKIGLYGLDNIGNTCYLNSIIQTLSNLKVFRTFLLNYDFVPLLFESFKTEPLENKITTIKNSIIYHFFRTIKIMWSTQFVSPSLKPVTLKKKLGLKNELFNYHYQQDVHEAFCFIIEMMHIEIAQKVIIKSPITNEFEQACHDFWAKEYSPIYTMFHSMYYDSFTCSVCKTERNTFAPCLTLTLQIPKKKSLTSNISNFFDIRCKIPSIIISDSVKEEMLKCIDPSIIEKLEGLNDHSDVFQLTDLFQEFSKENILDDYYCEKCECKQSTTSCSRLATTPNHLVINIKRFINIDDINFKKRNLIQFPIILDISQIVSEKYIVNNCKYKLVSVINHIGSSTNSGHYYSYTYSSVYEKWFQFNDSKVTEITQNKIVTENAYMLFYEAM